MADKANELQGITMLNFVAEAAQQAFTLATAKKTLLSLEKLRHFGQDYMERTGTQEDVIVNQILAGAEEHLMHLSLQAPQRVNDRLNRFLDDV